MFGKARLSMNCRAFVGGAFAGLNYPIPNHRFGKSNVKVPGKRKAMFGEGECCQHPTGNGSL